MGIATASNDAKAMVLQAVDLVELIGRTVKLKRRGRNYVGLCPFHNEKTPSFTVDPAKRYFRCYGCRESGNAIDFVMKRDRIDFVEALQQLAREYNIELPRLGSSRQNLSQRQSLLEAHSAACGFFEKLLADPQLGAAARDYLSRRGFSVDTLKRFQIGLAIDSWDALLRSAAMKRFSPQQLAEAGLVKVRENGGGYYDTFRNRIMFPIRDEQGRIIAFGGRAMPGSTDPAKYLNSPETPLFSKSRCVFGLDLARQKIVEQRMVAVVEGYTDVVMAHQYGATNVVSVLGTALTEQHVSILRRFADRIVLLFDADSAGDLAVNRAVELFLTQPVEIAIASMPSGVDPDEFLIQHGLEQFNQLLQAAQDALSYKWRQLQHQFQDSGELTSRQKAVEQYLEVLAAARGAGPIDPIRWGAALARVSRLTEIPAEELNRRFRMRRRPAAPRPVQAGPAAQVQPGDQPKIADSMPRPLSAEDRAERWVLGVLLAEPWRWAQAQQVIHPQDFTEENRRKLAQVYWDWQRDEGEPQFHELLGALEDPQLKDLAASLVEEVEAMSDLDRTLHDALEHMRQVRRRADERKLVAELRRTSDPSAVQARAANGSLPSRSPGSAKQLDEVELLRKLQETVRQPDIRRAPG
ncbi:DNA primase [Fontivita pretiosa]|uniref:DNA primase n=1 Tax=Fontivita pretiosa TaxID=2989684 RepID=UPI003D1811AB